MLTSVCISPLSVTSSTSASVRSSSAMRCSRIASSAVATAIVPLKPLQCEFRTKVRSVDAAYNSLYDVAVVDAPSIFLFVFFVSMGLTIVMFALGLGNLPGLAAGHLHGGMGHHGAVDF